MDPTISLTALDILHFNSRVHKRDWKHDPSIPGWPQAPGSVTNKIMREYYHEKQTDAIAAHLKRNRAAGYTTDHWSKKSLPPRTCPRCGKKCLRMCLGVCRVCYGKDYSRFRKGLTTRKNARKLP